VHVLKLSRRRGRRRRGRGRCGRVYASSGVSFVGAFGTRGPERASTQDRDLRDTASRHTPSDTVESVQLGVGRPSVGNFCTRAKVAALLQRFLIRGEPYCLAGVTCLANTTASKYFGNSTGVVNDSARAAE